MENNTLAREIIQAAKTYQENHEIVTLSYQDFMTYQLSGNRLQFESAYFLRRRELAVLALDYYLDKKKSKLPLLKEVIWQVLNEYTWALPAHLPQVDNHYALSSSSWIDLFAGETAETLAEIDELIGEDLGEWLHLRIAEEIDSRIFHSFEAHTWSWEHSTNNWAAVVGGCVGICALALLPKGSSRQLAILKRVDKAMKSYLSGFHEDGACLEGVGYWSYGFGFYIYFAQKMKDVYHNDSYLTIPIVEKIAEFPYHAMVRRNIYVPFSDVSPTEEIPSGLLSYCKRNLGASIPYIAEISSIDFNHGFRRFAHLLRNLLWTEQVDINQSLTNDSFFYPQSQWKLTRQIQRHVYFAAKGGRNDESHNHNDLGNFVFGNENSLFIDELGFGEYTRDYFGAQRYEQLANSALGHNVPIINGHLQAAGEYSSEVREYVNTAHTEQITFDLSNAYSSKLTGLRAYDRQFRLDLDMHKLVLIDKFHFVTDNNGLIENFLTRCRPQVDRNIVRLSDGAHTCTLNFASQALDVIPKDFVNHLGQHEQVFLIQNSIKAKRNSQIEITFTLN